MRVLVYKRTHLGDPDKHGCFGVNDCMGAVRKQDFDAVIGVGGIGPKARANEIAGKVTWIGIGAHKTDTPGKRGPLVTFEHFLDFGDDGPDFRHVAPSLAKRMYSRNVRHVMDDLDEQEYAEVSKLLNRAKKAPPSARHRTVANRTDRSRRSCQHRPVKRKSC